MNTSITQYEYEHYTVAAVRTHARTRSGYIPVVHAVLDTSTFRCSIKEFVALV